ncbi:MAG TPA: hypothetical protein VM581_00145 [Magnetospirillaceae bacterium]|nr:hypothetical protein [Magnetospirillaceae bacterium]
MNTHPRRRAAAFVAALTLALLGGSIMAGPAAAAPVPQPDSGKVTVLEGFDHSKASITSQLRRYHGDEFPTGNQFCTQSWHPVWCLQPLRAYAFLEEECGEFGSNVDIYIYNPNGRQAPRNLYDINAATGTGFGDDSFVPSGWSLFPITNTPPGVRDYLVRWDPQNLSFMRHWNGSMFVPVEQERLVLTCPSPPPPPPPGS